MTDKIYFSIVIPVYNREKTLKRCLDSILLQTYPHFEIICVDDNSTDSSLAVLESYKLQDSRIKIVRQKKDKKGAQAARKLGIIKSNYDWIMFNDSDDVWYADKIETELRILTNKKFDEHTVIYSNCNVINQKTGKIFFWKLPRATGKDSYKQLLFTSAPMFQSLCCSKKLLSIFGYIDENVPAFQEWDTSLSLAKNGGRFVHIQKPLFLYYVGDSDAISASLKKDILGRMFILHKYNDDINKYLGQKGIRHHYKNLVNVITSNYSTFAEVYDCSGVQEVLFYYFENLKTNLYLKKCKRLIQSLLKQ